MSLGPGHHFGIRCLRELKSARSQMRRGQRDLRRGRVVVIGRRRNRVTYPNREARFGAKTIAGAGAFRPTDSNGVAYDLTSYDSLVSGSLGSYVPSILNGGLRFTGGGAGAPAGAVLRCSHANGQVDITIGSLIANTYSVATLTEADAAYEGSVLGDRIELRAGSHNTTPSRVIIARNASPSGTWTGTSILSDGNWVVLTRDPGAAVTIGAIEVAGGGGSHPRYLRLDDLDFVSPFVADGNGLMPGGVGGQCQLNSAGSHVAVTNCRFRHASAVNGLSTGVARAINLPGAGGSSYWIEGNTVNGARHGIIGCLTDSVVRSNEFRFVLSDVMQIGPCNNAVIEDNYSTDKCYGYTVLQITGITRGAVNTVVTFASTAAITTGEPCVFDGVSGALGDFLNGKSFPCASKTATTATFALNTSSQPDWDGIAGTMHALSQFHGDHMQFSDDPGGDNLQDNVTIRGNRMARGNPGQKYGSSQGIFMGVGTRTRSNWLVEGNIYNDCAYHAITLYNPVNCVIRSNTVARQLGFRSGEGGTFPSINCLGPSSSSNTMLDNISNYYNKTGVTTDTNNAELPLTDNAAVPANASDVAMYQGAFQNPSVAINETFDPIIAFATRTDAGSAYPGPIYPGATPYFDFETLVYSDPRA